MLHPARMHFCHSSGDHYCCRCCCLLLLSPFVVSVTADGGAVAVGVVRERLAWQCPLLAHSVRGPQMVWEGGGGGGCLCHSVCVWLCVSQCVCDCVCVVVLCVWTEWTWSMHWVGISTHTYQFTPCYASAIGRFRRFILFYFFKLPWLLPGIA